MEQKSDSIKKLLPLTSLRFIAAALILIHHLPGHFGFSKDFGHGLAWGDGVSFFFVLSGFILTYVYSARPMFVGKVFLATRLARLWPAHIAAFLLLWLLTPESVAHDFSYPKLLAYLSLIHSWIPILEYNFSFVGPSWSISTEAGLYIFFLFLFPNWSRTWTIKLLSSFLLVVVIIWGVNVTPPLFHQSKEDSLLSLIYIWPFSRIFEFALGMAAAHLWFRHQFGRKISPVVASGLECGLLLLAAWTLQNVHFWTQEVSHLAFVGPAGARWLAQGGFPSLVFAGLIFVMASGKGFVSKLLSHQAPVLLGEISYSFYLIHQTLIFAWERYSRAFGNMPGGLQLAWLLTITLLLAYLIWAGIETPCRKKIGRILAGRETMGKPSKLFPVKAGFFQGSRNGIFGAAAVLALVLLPAAYLVKFKSNIRIVGEAGVASLLLETPEGLRDVGFGNKFRLRGVRIQSHADHLELNLVWMSLAGQKLTWMVPVHVVDQAGRILAQADYPQDTARSTVQTGNIWVDVVKIPLAKLKGAKSMAIGLLAPGSGGQWLLADKGGRDWQNSRLLIPLSQSAADMPAGDHVAARKNSSLTGFLDLVNADFITGWAWNASNAQERQIISLTDDGVWIGDANADLFRQDLLEARIGDGRYCFRLATPASLHDGRPHVIHALVKGTAFELSGSPARVTLPGEK